MKITQQKVTEFHAKHKFPLRIELIANKGIHWVIMWILVKLTLLLSQVAIKHWKLFKSKPESFYRFHLMLEELSEMMEGINNGDEIKTADGLGDTLYVVIGTASCYWLPADEISRVVCHSNSTKQVRTKTNIRLRDKGADWKPPDIAGAIVKGRKRMDKTFPTSKLQNEFGQEIE